MKEERRKGSRIRESLSRTEFLITRFIAFESWSSEQMHMAWRGSFTLVTALQLKTVFGERHNIKDLIEFKYYIHKCAMAVGDISTQ